MQAIKMKRLIPPDMQKYAAVGAVVFLAAIFFIGRTMHEHAMLQVKDIRQQLRRVQMEQEVGRRLNDLKTMRDKVKSERESSKFLAEVARLASQMNMRLVSIAALPVERYTEFMKLAVNLEFDTTYHEVGVFVSMVENSELFMFVNKLDLVLQDKTQEISSRVTARMVVSTISMNETLLEQ